MRQRRRIKPTEPTAYMSGFKCTRRWDRYITKEIEVKRIHALYSTIKPGSKTRPMDGIYPGLSKRNFYQETSENSPT